VKWIQSFSIYIWRHLGRKGKINNFSYIFTILRTDYCSIRQVNKGTHRSLTIYVLCVCVLMCAIPKEISKYKKLTLNISFNTSDYWNKERYGKPAYGEMSWKRTINKGKVTKQIWVSVVFTDDSSSALVILLLVHSRRQPYKWRYPLSM
jgi:hypothetical protein